MLPPGKTLWRATTIGGENVSVKFERHGEMLYYVRLLGNLSAITNIGANTELPMNISAASTSMD
ncbi:MAG: hypothetical protein ACTS5A_01510 [Candidatus Hodgkinia cicadicola]